MKNEKSILLTQKFNQLYPTGHSNFRVPVAVSEHRVFLERGEGGHLWDVDGNRYIVLGIEQEQLVLDGNLREQVPIHCARQASTRADSHGDDKKPDSSHHGTSISQRRRCP